MGLLARFLSQDNQEKLLRPVAKKFQYSTGYNHKIIENCLADRAAITGRTVSELIEEIVREDVLPKDPIARDYIQAVQLRNNSHSKNELTNYGIRDALSSIYQTVSAGDGVKVRYTNAKPLVEFGEELLAEHEVKLKKLKNPQPADDISELEYSFESLCVAMKKYATKSDNPALEREITRAREVILPNILSASVDPMEIMNLILRNWHAVADNALTFRVLYWLFRACKEWDDTPLDRIHFQTVCEQVMSEWTIEKREKEAEKRKIETESRLKKYPIASDDYVLAPADWVVVNRLEAPSCAYAGCMNIRHGVRYGAPLFLFFLNHPINEMTKDEQSYLMDLAKISWPDMQKVQNDFVELQYNADGGVANAAEHLSSPQVGFFGLYDSGEVDDPPYGAVIVRNNKGAEGQVNSD